MDKQADPVSDDGTRLKGEKKLSNRYETCRLLKIRDGKKVARPGLVWLVFITRNTGV